MSLRAVITTVLMSAIPVIGCAPKPFLVDSRTDQPLAQCEFAMSVIVPLDATSAEMLAVERATNYWNAQHSGRRFFRSPLQVNVDPPETPVGTVYLRFDPDPELAGKDALGVTNWTMLRNRQTRVACIGGALTVIRRGMSPESTENVIRHELGHILGLNDSGAMGVMSARGWVDDSYVMDLTHEELFHFYQLYPGAMPVPQGIIHAVSP